MPDTPDNIVMDDVSRWKYTVDKGRAIGSAEVVKGKIKEALGKAVGDVKLESEGKADKIEGEVQNAVGGLKDTICGNRPREPGAWRRPLNRVAILNLPRLQ